MAARDRDGYRLLADLHDGEVKLRSRNGLDWTDDFPEVVQAVQALPVRDARLTVSWWCWTRKGAAISQRCSA